MKKSIIFVLTLLCTGILFACGEKKIYNKWVEKDGSKYYYDKTGEMVKNKKCIIDGKSYYFLETGEMVKNKKCIIDGKSYYFLETGEMAKGIIQNGSRMQYYDESGCLVTNRIVKWNENSFLVDKDGNIVKNGWYKLSGDWYYVENNNLKSGWIEDSGSWYFLKTYSYSMCVNQWIGNDYYVGEDGKMLVNTTREIGGKKYIFDLSGKKTEIKLPQEQTPTTKTIENNTYAFDSRGFYSDPSWNINIHLENDLSEPIAVSESEIVKWKLYDLNLSIEPTNKGLVLYMHGIAEYHEHQGLYGSRGIHTGPQKPRILCRLKMIDDKGVTTSTSGESEGSSISVGEKTYVTWEIGYLPLFGGNIKMVFTGPGGY